ncbi:MAG TPA: nucleoside triphosphate pyrophosphohydrolase [Verrucomicrobiae bacterium]|nr:nucleoside triphosphate pyrophosphohydrolase [Verrucomicrobiae bacterium]
MENTEARFQRLMDIMRRLRGPGGCPWDAEQTHESLRRYLLEETYEVLEAVDAADDAALREELGDLVLQPVFHAVIAEEQRRFSMDDILDGICDKLVRRHPHVFGEMEIRDSAAQVENWEKIKKAEKGDERKSALAGVPRELPALLRAQKLTEKAARVGFDWDSSHGAHCKVVEELKELEEAMATGDRVRTESELGDLLFAVVNLGRLLSLDPEEALRKTISRFTRRFRHIEESLHACGREMTGASLEEMDRLWEEAKRLERGEETTTEKG